MKILGSFRKLWLLIPLILLVQIIAGLAQHAGEANWPHERVLRITPQLPVTGQNPPVKQTAGTGSVQASRSSVVMLPMVAAPAAAAPLHPEIHQQATPTASPVMITDGEAHVPILVYHHISDANPGNRYYTPVSRFRAQMQLLNEQGYTSITMAALIDSLEGRTPLPPRPIVLTFDDGAADVYLTAFPMMQFYGFTGVTFLIVNMLGGQGYLQPDQIREMLAAGWEAGSHSLSHADLSQPGVDVGKELGQSRLDLETGLVTSVQSFAYPYAVTSASIFQAAEDSGYTNAVCAGWNNTQRLSSRYCLSRREVLPEMSLEAFQKLIEEP